MIPSATQRISSTPELLLRIFQYSTPKENLTSNLVVCKLWSDEVLNVEWRELDQPLRLFQLLAPMTRSTKGIYRFSGRILPSDWKRFDQYARRVRKLRIQDLYDASIYLEIAIHRPRLALLPNLQPYICTPHPDTLHLFTHSAITSLHLNGDNPSRSEPITMIFLYLAERMPVLQHLSVEVGVAFGSNSKTLDSVVSSILAMLTELRSVSLPPRLLSSSITNSISTLPKLTTVHSQSISASSSYPRPEEVFSDDLNPTSFPSLVDLNSTMPFSRAAVCFTGAYRPITLSKLSLSPESIETLDNFAKILQVIPDICPQLEDLTLEANNEGSGKKDEEVSFDYLEPLLSCKTLKALRLGHPCPFQLTQDDVSAILSALPLISRLYLNPNPRKPARFPGLHLSYLSTLASMYPSRLEEIGLVFDTSPEGFPKHDEIITFSHLRKLSVGASRIMWYTDPNVVAAYLSHILRENCIIEHSTTKEEKSQSSWNQVVKTVPTLIQVLRDGERRACTRCLHHNQ